MHSICMGLHQGVIDMKITYICGVTGIQTVGTSDALPNGWLIPPNDVARDMQLPVPAYGTVIAISSEDMWKRLLKARLEQRQ